MTFLLVFGSAIAGFCAIAYGARRRQEARERRLDELSSSDLQRPIDRSEKYDRD